MLNVHQHWDVLFTGHSIDGRVWTTIAGLVRLEGSAMMDLERRSLIRVGGGVGYTHRCGCLSASARVWYRPGRRWPDVLIMADLGGLSSR